MVEIMPGSSYDWTERTIRRVCISLIGSDGLYVPGVLHAICEIVPDLQKLPLPKLTPKAPSVPIMHMEKSPYFFRSAYEFEDSLEETLVVCSLGLGVIQAHKLNTAGVPYLLFSFCDKERAPEGFNVLFRRLEAFTFENGQLIHRGTFKLLPEYSFITVTPILHWRVKLT